MSSLPTGWARAPLGDFGDLQLGKMLDRARNSGQPTPYLRNINVRWGGFDLNHLLSVPLSEDERARFDIRDGDVLVCEGGEPGRAAVWRGGPTDIKYQKALHRVRLADDVLPELLCLYLRHLSNNRDLEDHFTGTTIKHLPREVFARLPIPLPPLPEQQRIVAKLVRLSARSRAARDHLARTAKLAARARQAILAAAFRGELTSGWRKAHPDLEPASELVARTPEPEQSRGGRKATTDVIEGVGGMSVNDPGTVLPVGWSWVRLRRVARQETGHTPSRSRPEWWGGDVPWIGIRDANGHHGAVINDTMQTTNPDGLANSSARLLPAGTVCLSRTASVGYVTMMGRPMATSQDFATWTCTGALDPWYLMLGLMSEGDDIRRFGEGTTHTTIYFPEIRALHIKLAPLEEQREIVRRINSAFARIDRMNADAVRAAHLLERLVERLLAKAFRGELVPQDPSDEPAEALLARIRAARVEAPTRSRARRRRAG